jgi:hypothetical protein
VLGLDGGEDGAMLSAPGMPWLAWSAAALSLVATRCWVLGELVGVREIIPTNEWRRLLQCRSIQAITFVTEVVAGWSFRAKAAGCVASRESTWTIPCPIGGQRRSVGAPTCR